MKTQAGSTEFKPIGRGFYMRETLDVAKDLLGQLIVRVIDGELIVARITEVEAYRGLDDPASHAYRGNRGKARIMFESVGIAYVYLSYGVHYCLNVVAKSPQQEAGAVLIRSGEPVVGYEVMRKLHDKEPCRVSSGPGNLTRSLGINLSYNGHDLTRKSDLFISGGWLKDGEKVISSRRIGISNATDMQWRFLIEGNCTVSKKLNYLNASL